MNRDDLEAELLEIEGLPQDDRLKDEDRHGLHGAQALRNVCKNLAARVANVIN
jgi:hypothetical protein